MIEKLKAEVFDILKSQDILKLQFAELERQKQEKLKELERYEKNV